MNTRKLRLKTKPDEGKVPDDIARWVESYVGRRLTEDRKRQSVQLLDTLVTMLTLAETQFASAILNYHAAVISKPDSVDREWLNQWTGSRGEWQIAGASEDLLHSSFDKAVDAIDRLAESLAPEELERYKEYRKGISRRVDSAFAHLLESAQDASASVNTWVNTLINEDFGGLDD